MSVTPPLTGRRGALLELCDRPWLVGACRLIMQAVDRLRERVAALPLVVVDAAVALALAGVNLSFLWWLNPVYAGIASFTGPSPMGVVLALATTLPVAVRRRFPLSVLATVAIFEILAIALIPSNGIGVLMALYTVAAYCPRCRSLTALTVLLIAVVIALYHFDRLGYLITDGVMLVGAWLVGYRQQIHWADTAELHRRAAQLAQEREHCARLVVAQERVRIARELHDVLAHHVSVMGIQATAARRVFDHRREDAVAALTTIETASRQAMHELHHLVGLLRHSDDTDDTDDRDVAPQPGLGQLPALVAEIRKAGLPVQLIIEGDQRPLPSTVELSAYRIIQEALTNTLNHAGPAHAWIRLRYRNTGLELEVLDNGHGPPPTPPTGGNGLVGMRERVTLHGGHLETGARPEGGFRVHATLDRQSR
jgi:signal transduction histidine kinase